MKKATSVTTAEGVVAFLVEAHVTVSDLKRVLKFLAQPPMTEPELKVSKAVKKRLAVVRDWCGRVGAANATFADLNRKIPIEHDVIVAYQTFRTALGQLERLVRDEYRAERAVDLGRAPFGVTSRGHLLLWLQHRVTQAQLFPGLQRPTSVEVARLLVEKKWGGAGWKAVDPPTAHELLSDKVRVVAEGLRQQASRLRKRLRDDGIETEMEIPEGVTVYAMNVKA